MNQDFSELIEYLDEKFISIDKRFENIDEKFGNIDEKLENIDKRFENIDEKFGNLLNIFATKEDLKEAIANLSTKEDFDNPFTAVDAYAKKTDTYFQEMLMLAYKVDRQEKWIHQIADKIGLKLEY